MKKTFVIIFLAAAFGILSLNSALAGEVTFKAVAFIPKNHPLMSQTIVWVDMINKELAGKVKINYIGGPEVIPGLQQVEAVRKGVIDIAFNPTAYYQNIFRREGHSFCPNIHPLKSANRADSMTLWSSAMKRSTAGTSAECCGCRFIYGPRRMLRR